MLTIIFNNIMSFKIRSLIKKLFESALIEKFGEKKDIKFIVGVKYVNEKEIKNLNKKFRNIDKETDVLSFPIYDFNFEKFPNEKDIILGDIIICKTIAKKQAKLYSHSFKREVCFLALHGFLHLLGFDHVEKEDEEKMNKISKKILLQHEVKR